MLAIVDVVALPELFHRRHELAQPRTGGHRVDAVGEARVLEAVGAAGDADVEPPAGDDIRHGRLSGELDGVPEGRHDGAGAEPYTLGLRRQVGDVDERIRCDGELHAVVLTDPDGLEATRLRHLNERGQLVEDPGVRNARVLALHVGKERKLHGLTTKTARHRRR